MYHFIVNPNARSGLGKETWAIIEPVLVERNIDYQIYETKYQRHATAITRKITAKEGPHNIVVLGGDGTVNEVVNGISHLAEVTLGYIPIGSSNDFARGFKLPKDILKALDSILTPTGFAYMDVGFITYGENKKRRFGVSSGLGFDAGVCHEIMISKFKTFFNKIKLGKLGYTAVALSQLIKAKPASMDITIDGHTTHYDRVLFAAAMNHKYEGGGFMFAPKADPCDGALDFIVVNDISKPYVLCLLPLAFKGLHTFSKKISLTRGKTATFKSNLSLPIHTDGEPVFLHKELNIGMEEKKLRVIIKPSR